MPRLLLVPAMLLTMAAGASAQEPLRFTRADTLRGTNGPARSWWDVAFYDLHVAIQPADSSIRGHNAITYRALEEGRELQIDLQQPLEMDSVLLGGRRLDHRRDGNAFFVTLPEAQPAGHTATVTAHYHGRPVVARRPPWDGGFIWEADSLGNRWVATANQGLGASVWWPNKDYMGEEPDSQRISIRVPTPMVNVSNGRLRSTTLNPDGTTTFEWFVRSPINNYNVTVNAGAYAHWRETFEGERGTLTMDLWPLAHNEAAARRQWTQARTTLQCFEHWFGPFPWYEDGFQMIETPHLGMEHQSAIAYGNGYQNGYLGRDLSGTGHGLEWDFIVVHEAAHEWWGNNVTVEDGADLWVHEGFANYSENLYTECLTGSKQAGAEYVIGTRAGIQNDRPIVGHYGVNDEGSGDRYAKGGNLLHTIRQLVDDDALWRSILRGLNEAFGRQTVTSADVENYIADRSGLELGGVFDQYLRTTLVPAFEYEVEGSTLRYRWADVVPGFAMPVRVMLEPDTWSWLRPTERWQSAALGVEAGAFRVDPNFYVEARTPGG